MTTIYACISGHTALLPGGCPSCGAPVEHVPDLAAWLRGLTEAVAAELAADTEWPWMDDDDFAGYITTIGGTTSETSVWVKPVLVSRTGDTATVSGFAQVFTDADVEGDGVIAECAIGNIVVTAGACPTLAEAVAKLRAHGDVDLIRETDDAPADVWVNTDDEVVASVMAGAYGPLNLTLGVVDGLYEELSRNI